MRDESIGRTSPLSSKRRCWLLIKLYMKIIWNFYGANLTWRHDEPQRERSILLSCSGLGHKSTKSFWPWIWSWSTVGGLWGLIPSTASVAYFGQYTSAVAQKDFLLSAENGFQWTPLVCSVGSELVIPRRSWRFSTQDLERSCSKQKYIKASTIQAHLDQRLVGSLDRWSELLCYNTIIDSSTEVRRQRPWRSFLLGCEKIFVGKHGSGEDFHSCYFERKVLTSAAFGSCRPISNWIFPRIQTV